jgi:2',3'-cyclic-nucleotide 2'-phosphodiesterase (5'-nucleotidase family)
MRRNLKLSITLLIVVMIIISFLSFAVPLARAEDSALTSSVSYGNIYLDTLSEHGILTGYTNSLLSLNQTLTRADFATMMVKAFPDQLVPFLFGSKHYIFKDTSPSYGAGPYIEALALGGFVQGYGDGTFRPNNYITEQEAIVILSRLLGVWDFSGIPDVLGNFTDASSVSSWAKDYINLMVSKGIFNGYSGNLLGPTSTLTVRQIAPIIVNARFPVITILHTNDFHMYLLGSTDSSGKPIGGSARIATVVENERAYNPNTILVDAGDAIGGGPPIGAFFYGEDVVKVYNAMDYDYMTFGNHEFDWGKDLLATRMSEAQYKYICANVVDSTTGEPFADSADVMKNVGFVNVGIFGLDTKELPILVNPTGLEGLDILDPIQTASNEVSKMANQANYIVVLSHLGYDQDQILAKDVSGINLVIGGHTHTVLATPTIVNGTYIVQTGSYGNNLGKVTLKFEAMANSAKLIDTKYELIPINSSISEDPTISAIIAPYNDELKVKMDDVIGEALVTLNGERKDIRSKETNLGDYVADWMKDLAGADIAITNGGGIRASIPKGPITVGSVYTILPFDNLLVNIQITGEQVVEAIENGLSQVELGAGRFPQISGIMVKADLSKAAGSRVLEVTFNGEPIDPEKVYTVVTNDFMAAGGDGYSVFTKAQSSKWVTGNWMRDDLVTYIKANPEVNVTVDGRMTFVTQQ